jgi:hypothetical protein
MGMTFNQYAGLRDSYNEGIFSSLFGSSLPDNLRRKYDLMTPEARAEIQKETEAGIPLAQAIQNYLASEPARNQMKVYQKMAGPERATPRRIMSAPHDFSQWNTSKYRR